MASCTEPSQMACDPQQLPNHRYVTTNNIRAGDVILEEEPWTWNMLCINGQFEATSTHKMVCYYCLLLPGKLLTCSACKSAWYCSKECQRADWNLRHKHGDCRMQKALALLQTSEQIENFGTSMHQVEFFSVIRRLLLSAASKRLFSEKQRDENGNPVSPLWHALLNSPSKTDSWVDVNNGFSLKRISDVYLELVQMITWDDVPNKLIEKRVLPSLVYMCDYGGWKNLAQSMQPPAAFASLPAGLALGACLEMSKFPNNCNPNAIIINKGRLARMVALEDIPNLDAVRLSRTPAWFDPRFNRRTKKIHNLCGFDCNCARCCAGDSGETLLFALRCPNWAALYSDVENTSTGCDGIVTGLRRTDIEPETVAVFDEPHPLPAKIMKKPAHQRAECQKCHARYSKETMNSVILKPLAFMAHMDHNPERYARSDSATRELCMTMVGSSAEKYIYPTNYAYAAAEDIMLSGCINTLTKSVQLDVNTLMWLQRCARRMLARIECEGYKQHDLADLIGAAAVYLEIVRLLRRESGTMPGGDGEGERAANLHDQTADTLRQVAMAALQKLGPVLVHG